MFKAAEARRRVERLLQCGDRARAATHASIYDLERLLLLLRHDTAGREFVAELADHVAHPEGRERGAVTHAASGFFACISLYNHLHSKDKVLDFANMPPEFPLALRTTLVRLSKKTVREETGLNQAEAQKHLDYAIAKFKQNDDGTHTLDGSPGSKELRILKLTASSLVAQPAFTDTQLLDQLIAVLGHHKLFASQEERRSFRRLRPLISLFAVAAMHDSRTTLSQGSQCHLLGSATVAGDGHIAIGAFAQFPIPKKSGTFTMATAMFTTSLKSQDYCHDALKDKNIWRVPIAIATGPLRLTAL